jgi:ParB family chromosome partitioning protein
MSSDVTPPHAWRLGVQEIPISLLDDNPFNSRIDYAEEEVEKLKCSLAQVGLLTPIKVREKKGRYQVVFGHKRARAAKALNWATIKAEVSDTSDEEMCQLSLIENAVRNDLSDYEKAVSLSRLNKEFGKTCEEIGQELGLSKQHVSNYIKMLDLFDETTLSLDPFLRSAIYRITERHARVLARIADERARADALKLVVLENFSVRELERVLRNLGTWFSTRELQLHSCSPKKVDVYSPHSNDIAEINNALLKEFSLPGKGDFESFAEFHAYNAGFSIFSYFPTLQRCEDDEAVKKERQWFSSVAPNFTIDLHDVSLQFYGQVAIVTLYVDYRDRRQAHCAPFRTRGTLVFVNRRKSWKIVHEHFSLLNPNGEDQTLTAGNGLVH